MRSRRASSRSPERHALAAVSLVVVLGAVLAVAVGTSGGAGASGQQAPANKPPAKNAKKAKKPAAPRVLAATGVIRWGELFGQATGYERYAYVLVSRQDARRSASLPGTTLVYTSGTSIQRGWTTGVTHNEAVANDWLLKDASGAHVLNVKFGAYVADIGNPAYQRRFLKNTLAFLKRTRVDGIFIDDVLGDPSGMSNVYPAAYPTTEAWENAIVSFVHAVGKPLKARGYYVLANAAKFIGEDVRSDNGEHVAGFWKRLSPAVSGLMTEYWLQRPTGEYARLRTLGTNWDQHWPAWQNLVALAQSRGVDFFGLSYGGNGDTRIMRYARASFMLDWDGKGGAFLYSKTDTVDPYHPVWVRQFGKPLGSKIERGSGVWQRRYERGIVVVNATTAPTSLLVAGKRHSIGPADAIYVAVARSG